jgi:hypothetical protein
VPEKGLTCAAIQMVGALRKASLSFYSQDDRKYLPKLLNEPLEILSGLGQPLAQGRPALHPPASDPGRQGTAGPSGATPKAGWRHLRGRGLHHSAAGQSLTRVFDRPPGLFLWEQ